MPFLPLFLDLTRGPVVLAGAGSQALAKLALLRGRGAQVRWYPMAVDAVPPIGASEPHLEILDGEPGDDALASAIAVVIATGSDADERIAEIAGRLRIPVNVVDRPELSSFIFPAIVDRGDVVVAISTGGTAPVLARRLRERIEALLPENIGALAAFIGRWRKTLRTRFGAGSNSRQFWERFVDSPLAEKIEAGDAREAESWMEALGAEDISAAKANAGSVTLVGAGPGDPDLLTLKALHALQNADMVFYDELVSPETLNRVRRDAQKLYVGKRKGKPGEDVESISRRLIEAARTGARVVRLKGGDPFIFGRGGEELEALRAANIPVAIVPGITAALGCAAEAELPLTFRGEATRLLFLTGHLADEKGAIDWPGLINPETTLVIYMGLSATGAIHDGLIGAGRDPATPAAIIARGTLVDSKSAAGTLAELPALAAEVGDGPALLIVGAVVARSKIWQTRRVKTREPTLAPV